MPRKKLIEVALPLEAINAASAREKSIRHGHPSTLHLWWARRPLAAARAVIFASLVDDPGHHPTPDAPPNEAPPEFIAACRDLERGKNAQGENDTPRMRLFDFIERLVTWESTTDEEVLETARELIRLSTDGNPPPLLDPFAGGGSIPLEAQRLGLAAHASDLNPVAVMINKALIEIPPRFANCAPVNPAAQGGTGGGAGWQGAAGLAADVRYYGEWMRDRAAEKIGHLYPDCHGETVIAWLWARTVPCPNPACGAAMPLISSFDLSRKKGRRAWVVPIIDHAAKTVRYTIKTGKKKPKDAPKPPKVGRGAKFRCLVCEEVAPDQHLKDAGLAGKMGAQLMAVVTEGNRGRNYYPPSPEHEQIAHQAKPEWEPRGELAHEPRAMWCKGYGLIDFADLFTPRQLTALTTFSDLLTDVRTQIRADAQAAGLPPDETPLHAGGRGAMAYAEAVSVYLAFAVDRGADYWSGNVTWTPNGEFFGHTFARQAIPMVWDYAEANPFSESSGNWLGAIAWIAKVLDKLLFLQSGKVVQQDVTMLSYEGAIAISTDPPYYDNIGYADLSDYFYVWLRQNLRAVYPDIFKTMLVPKTPELIATPYRFDGDRAAAEQFFEQGLQQAFIQMRQIAAPDYPFTVYYAFKQQEVVAEGGTASTGWETMLTGLISSGFQIVGTWPMRTERSARSVGQGTNALASSIVLVCRPRPADAPLQSRRGFLQTLRVELPAALEAMQSGNIAPVDLAQASIGPGIGIYSRYRQVLEADGTPLTVRTALQLINRQLDAYLAEQEGHVDPETRFAIGWFEQYGFKAGPFGTADVLARARNASLTQLKERGVLTSAAGQLQLLHWDELSEPPPVKEMDSPSVWQVTHWLIARYHQQGEQGTGALLTQLPGDVAAEARQLAYRLYNICERKGWTEHARDYNALVVSWGEAQQLAHAQRQQGGYQQSGMALS